MNVIGMRKFEYKSKRSGEIYPAANLYCTEDRKGVAGKACFDLFCKAELVPGDLAVGDEVRVFYNRFGSVESMEIIK